jgi:hypothetical protein
MTPCPYCSALVPETTLDCKDCKSHIPYCIASGKHMVVDDWYECPCCGFPGIGKHLKPIIKNTGSCPMCYASVTLDSLVFKSPLNTEFTPEKVDESVIREPIRVDGSDHNVFSIGGLAV